MDNNTQAHSLRSQFSLHVIAPAWGVRYHLMFNKELLIGFSTIFGWTPSLILVLAAVFSALTGIVSIGHGEWSIGLLLIFIGVTGILGFIALTSVCWGLKLQFHKRFAFLICGVTSLSIVVLIGLSGIFQWFTLYFSWVTAYLYFCPLIIGLIHVGLHVHFFKKGT